MAEFAIIEVPDGLEVVEIPAGKAAEEVAAAQGGTLVDAGPFHSYDDAYDAMINIESEEEEEEERA